MKIARIVDIRRGGFLGFGGHMERYIEIEAYNELMSEMMQNTPSPTILQQAIEDVTFSMLENERKNLFGLAALQMLTLQWLRRLEK